MASVEFTSLPEEQQLAFHGTLFAMAASDGHVSAGELRLILESIDVSALSRDGLRTLRGWLVEPPELEDCLITLAQGERELQFGVLMHLTDVALADERVLLGEKRALRMARERFGIERAQALAIEEFVWGMREIRDQHLSDEDTVRAVKAAAEHLGEAGVPSSAIYYSGSFVGLGTTGVLAGLAALGLGLGLVPGLGVAVAVGTATFLAVNWALGDRASKKREQVLAEQQRRARRFSSNLEQALAGLAHQLDRAQDEGRAARVRQRIAQLRALLPSEG
jgi:hypothetical protein